MICVNGGTFDLTKGERGECVCPPGWIGELCEIKECDTTEYPLLEKDLDTEAYTYEECVDIEKHYKKTISKRTN